MNKAAIICKLHAIADHCLLGLGNWPANEEYLAAFNKTVRDLGLNEDVPDSLPGTTRSTPLGKELQLDLLMVFVGAWDIWEIPYILESNGYIEELETEELYSALSEHVDLEVRRCVRRAYFKFCNRSELLN